MLTRALLNERYWYDEVLGELRYKVRSSPASRVQVNEVAGTINSSGYRVVCVNGKQHRVHRLIWMMLVGEIPAGYQIDHIDGNRANNHISNLRLATRVENGRNAKKRCDNTSGTKGVSFDKLSGKWRVQIRKDGKNTSALFETKDEALGYVRQARELLHEDFTNHGV